MTKRLPMNVHYIHITFSLPEEIRDIWLKYRHTGILNIIFQEAHNIIKNFFMERFGIVP